MSIEDLLARYFVTSSDVSSPGESVPQTSDGNVVTPLIDGDDYFGALRAEVTALKAPGGDGKFFYFANWWLALTDVAAGSLQMGSGSSGASSDSSSSSSTSGSSTWNGTMFGNSAFVLDDESGGSFPKFIDELADMSSNGTDVRAFAWVNPLVVTAEEAAKQSGVFHVNAMSLLSVDAIRQKAGMGKNACLDLLGHTLGAMHLKMVVCGDSSTGRAYVSGLDFVGNRVDGRRHPNGANSGWHDAGVKLEGAAVQGVYDYFKALWNEQIGRSQEKFTISGREVTSHVDGTPTVPDRTFSSASTGGVHVQVLRTGPQFHFALTATERAPIGFFARMAAGFSRSAWSFAPDGIFEFSPAVMKAISNAKKYIYIEDQGFIGQPIMDALRTALAANTDLKLIMVHHADPADGPGALKATSTAINRHLGSGGSNMDAQVAFYERQDSVVVHTKLWIIDDEYAIVGSANCYRRSLFTDGEISAGILDEDSSSNNFAVRMRLLLWGEHCGLYNDVDRAPLTDLSLAIKIWDSSWSIGPVSTAGAAPASLQSIYQRKKVPFEVGSNPDQFTAVDDTLTALEYDRIDADSRLEY